MLGIDMTLRMADNFNKSIYRMHNSKFQLIQIIGPASQAQNPINWKPQPQNPNHHK